MARADHLTIGVDSDQRSHRRSDGEISVQDLATKGSPSSRRSHGVISPDGGSSLHGERSRANSVWSSANFDQLDRERDDELDFAALDDFLADMAETVKDTAHQEAQRVRTLEKTLENEKRRLAQMEVELRDAQRKRQAGESTFVVQKQSKLLEVMANMLGQATQKEMEERTAWEEEWRGVADEMRIEHRSMDEALRRKHASEIEKAQSEVAKDIKRTAVALKAKGRPPSPGALQRMHAEKLKTLVQLYHHQGQERLFLQARLSEQEQLMLRQKNESRQRSLAASQARSNPVYKRFELPAVSVKTHGSLGGSFASMASQSAGGPKSAGSGIQSRYFGDSSHHAVRTPGTAKSGKSSGPGTTKSSKRGGRGATFQRLDGFLPSPRLDFSTGGATFVTAIEGDDEQEESRVGRGASRRPATRGGTADSHAYGSRRGTADKKSPWSGKHLQSTQMSVDVGGRKQQPSPFGTPGQAAMHSGKAVGTEFSERDPPTLPSREGGREAWDTRFRAGESAPPPPQRWHPNVIAFETAFAHKKTKTLSPYEAKLGGTLELTRAAPASTTGPKLAATTGGRTTGAGAGQRTSVSAAAGAGAGQRTSVSAAAGAGAGHRTSVSAAAGAGAGLRGSAAQGGGLATLPGMQWGKNQPTESNMNRPRTDAAKNDDYELSGKERYAKLEEWIESKIHGVLGVSSAGPSTSPDTRGGGGGLRGSVAASPVRAESRGYADSSDFGIAMYGGESDYVSSRGLDTRGAGTSRGDVGLSRGSMAMSRGDGASRGSLFTADSRDGLSSPEGVYVYGNNSDVEFHRAESGESAEDHIDELTAMLKGGPDPRSMRGLSVEGRKEAEEMRQAQKLARWGAEIEQKQNVTDDAPVYEETTGKFTREGKFLELQASEDVDSRRSKFNTLASDKNRRSISWNIPEGEEPPDGHPEGAQSRPETSASIFTSASGDDLASLKGGQRGGGAVLPSSRSSDSLDKDKFFSAVRHNKVEEVEGMLNAGMGLHERDAHGNSPLMVASQNGHKRLVKMFLRYGSDANASNHQGNTALHFASAYGYTALAQYLIEKGADDTLMNMKGLTCYDGLG